VNEGRSKASKHRSALLELFLRTYLRQDKWQNVLGEEKHGISVRQMIEIAGEHHSIALPKRRWSGV
jgi:metal-responsive CopG/Arc/MetJ family transcriptional regulator